MNPNRTMWRAYIGHDNATRRPFLERDIWAAIHAYVDGATLTPCQGYAGRAVEASWAVDFIGSAATGLDVAEALRKAFKQNSVLLVELGRARFV